MTTATASTNAKIAKPAVKGGKKKAQTTKRATPSKVGRTSQSTAAQVRERIRAAGEAARRRTTSLGRAGAEAIDEARTGLDGTARRAGKVGREVYLAGLGALAAVDERSRAVWSELISQGEKVAPRDPAAPLRAAGTRLKRIGSRLESTIEKRVQRGLERLGVPSRGEIHELSRRVEALSAKIDRIDA